MMAHMHARCRPLLGIFLLALATRAVYLLQISDSPLWILLLGDAQGYDAWARQIAGGAWWGQRVFYQAPLYPYFLALIYASVGPSLLAVRAAQIVLGSAACVLLSGATARWWGQRAGWIAGIMLALYPPALFFDGLIQKSALDGFLMALLLWTLAYAGARTCRRGWVLVGVTLGLLALTRENALVFVPCAWAWALWRPTRDGGDEAVPRQSRGLTGGVVRAGWVTLGLLVILLPVALRNLAVGGEFHLTTSQLGPNFYIGNHAGADGSYTPLRFGRGNVRYEADDARELAELALGRALSPGEVSRYWLTRAWDDIAADPSRWLRLLGWKALLTTTAVEVGDTEDLYTYAESSSLLRTLNVGWHMGVLLPLAGLGVVLLGRELRRGWIVPTLALVYAGSVIAFYVFARYRLPLAPLLMVLAAGGLAKLPAGWRGLRATHQAGAATVALLLAAVSNWPAVSVERYRGITEHNIGVELMNQLNQPAAALSHLQRAIHLAPSYAPAYNALGLALTRLDRDADALAAYQQALALRPNYADACYNLALAQERLGQPQAAAASYARTLELEPQHAQAHNNLGLLLARAGALEPAITHYRQALAADPRLATAHNNLGVALARLGQYSNAAACFAAALQIDPDYADAQTNLARAQAAMGAVPDDPQTGLTPSN